MTANPSRKHLVLLGAGRANVQVLAGLARHGYGDLDITLVAPHPNYIERTMLAGYVAGDYALDDIRIPLDTLLQSCGAGYIPAHAVALDPVARRVQLSSGDALPYDVLSIDADLAADRPRIEADMPGAGRNALFTLPLENFVKLWPQVRALATERALQVAVIGSGRIAVELALACSHALADPHGSRVTLVCTDQPLLPGEPARIQRKMLERLKDQHITVLQERCTGLDGRELQLANGARLVCDAPLLAAPATPPAWLLQAGLQAGEDGLPLVNERLQSESHRQIFIVPPRAPLALGPVLEHNLRTALAGGSYKKAPLAPSPMRLLASGAGRAAFAWGPFTLEGREIWRSKDRRDRKRLATMFRI